MKKTVLIIALALLGSVLAGGQEFSSKVAVSNMDFDIREGNLCIGMDMDFSRIQAEATEMRSYSLVIYDKDNYVILPVAKLLGRSWFYHYAREKRTNYPFSKDDHTWYWKKAPSPYRFEAEVPYREWMENANIRIDAEVGGCCGKPGRDVTGAAIASAVLPVLAKPEPEPERPVFHPHFIYVLPPAETTVKSRDVSGEAYVVFASGKTAVDPTYQNNQAELDKIHATIDSVKADADVTITKVLLRGYSSPDGRYATNEKLALLRTQAIKDYVSTLDSLDENVFVSEAVAENWEGLRKAVEESEIYGRDKILSIIDSNISPDGKESKIKQAYPKQWAALVKDVFPLLRRTDYSVNYTVRSYTTTEDARRIMHISPDKLSVTEFFLAAKGYKMGTREFDDVFAIAARVYPDNEVVNINAASAALSLGNIESARKYLLGAGDSPEATYTKGVCAALQEDWEKAVSCFALAKDAGIEEAAQAYETAIQILDFGK